MRYISRKGDLVISIRKPFLWTFTFFILLWTFSMGPTRQEKIQRINSEIEQLEEMKRGYESRALKHDNYAEYLQFKHEAYLEMKRHLELADENRTKAALCQQKIDQLKEERQKLGG